MFKNFFGKQTLIRHQISCVSCESEHFFEEMRKHPFCLLKRLARRCSGEALLTVAMTGLLVIVIWWSCFCSILFPHFRSYVNDDSIIDDSRTGFKEYGRSRSYDVCSFVRRGLTMYLGLAIALSSFPFYAANIIATCHHAAKPGSASLIYYCISKTTAEA